MISLKKSDYFLSTYTGIDYKILPPQSGCAPAATLPSPASPDNDFYDFYHTFDANYYKNPPPQSGF